MTIPSSISMARSLIKENPNLFTDHFLAEVRISKAMRDYHDECIAYANKEQSTIEAVKDQLKHLNNLSK